MILSIKILLIISLLFVFLQDVKTREVYWILFPVIASCCGILHYQNVVYSTFIYAVGVNFIFISLMLLVIYLYSKYKLKMAFKNTFGLGDVLLFIGLTLSFSTTSFIILFVFSLVFALVLHLFFKTKTKIASVPLAGYLSLFFASVYVSHWLGAIPYIYII